MGSVKPGYRERWFGAQDGLKLFFRDYGDPLAAGMPVLCLGGLTRNSKDFDKLARRLSGHRRVVCPDYRGRGRSSYDDDWRNYRPEVYLNDLIHLLAVCNLHRVVICGTSMGGLLSMGMAVAAPTVVAGVILNDIGPELHHRGLSRILEYIGVDQPQPDWEAAVTHLKSLFPRLGLGSDAAWREFAEATYRVADDGLLHYDWDLDLAKPLIRDGSPDLDLWKIYGALRQKPVLALRGELSDVFAEETFTQMAEVKPDLVRVTVPGVGHPPMLDEPPAEMAIDHFLAEIDSRQSRATQEPSVG